MKRSVLGAVLGSVGVLAAAVGGLAWRSGDAGPAVQVFAAASTRPPLERIAADFEASTGRPVRVRYGASDDVLTQATLADTADVFLPADDSYVRAARERGLVAESLPVATMRAVLLLPTGNPKLIDRWSDLTKNGTKVAVANPAAAIGKLAREHLTAAGKWAELEPRVVATGTVTEAANAAKLGAADAAIVWDAVAQAYPGQPTLDLPELAGITAKLEVAVLTKPTDAAAATAFAEYVAGPGKEQFRAAGFAVVDR